MLSYPKRKPPRVETLAATTRGVRGCAGAEKEFSLPPAVARFNGRFSGQHKAERVRHARMPWRRTRHLWSVVGDEHAGELIAMKDGENTHHVHIAFVNKSFAIVRHFPDDIAQMNIRNLTLFAVLINGVVNVSFCHFG